MRAWLASGVRLPLAIAAAALILYACVFGNPYTLRLLTISGTYALLVIGYQFIFGYAGALSLAQGAFFGLGAYVTGILGSQFGWSFPATFPLSIALPGIVALVVAIPVIRLESHYFALATLGVGQVVLLAAVNWQSLTGGANGIAGIPDIAVFGIVVRHGMPLLIVVWGFVVLGGWLAWQATRGLYGRAFEVVRENDIAAQSLGIDVGRLRFIAFLASAAYAGAAGALYAHTIQVISPATLEFPLMVSCLAMAVVGGRGRVAGAVLGALLLVQLPEWFRFLSQSYLIAYGGALLVAIIAAPWGIIGALERLRQRLFPESAQENPRAVPLPQRRMPARSAKAVLEVEGAAISFGGVRALDGVDLTVRYGESVGLIGPNGSGKTTLVNLVSGLYPVEHGRIRLLGRDITRKRPFRIARLGVARSFQSTHLVEDMTALDNVAVARVSAARADGDGLDFGAILAAGLTGGSLSRARGQAMTLLATLGLEEIAQHPCRSLPHGLKRQVEIARALALEPTLLMLDEPAAGLSEAEQAELASRLKTLSRQGLTLLIIEHNMPFLMPLVERMVCLENGRVIAAGSPAEVGANPRVIEAYLGAPAPAKEERRG